jgi:hypothetical protein
VAPSLSPPRTRALSTFACSAVLTEKRPHSAERTDPPILARLPTGVASGRALRLPGTRTLRSRRGAPVQSDQAAARSLRQGDQRPHRLGRRRLRVNDRHADADLSRDDRDSAPFVPRCIVIDPASGGRGRTPPHPLGEDNHLRAAREGVRGARRAFSTNWASARADGSYVRLFAKLARVNVPEAGRVDAGT